MLHETMLHCSNLLPMYAGDSMQVQPADSHLVSSCCVCKFHKDGTFEILAIEVPPQPDTIHLEVCEGR